MFGNSVHPTFIRVITYNSQSRIYRRMPLRGDLQNRVSRTGDESDRSVSAYAELHIEDELASRN